MQRRRRCAAAADTGIASAVSSWSSIVAILLFVLVGGSFGLLDAHAASTAAALTRSTFVAPSLLHRRPSSWLETRSRCRSRVSICSSSLGGDERERRLSRGRTPPAFASALLPPSSFTKAGRGHWTSSSSLIAQSSAASSGSAKLETKRRMALRDDREGDRAPFFSGALREGLSVGFSDSEVSVRPLPSSSWSPSEEEEETLDNADSHYIDSLCDQNMNRNTIDEAKDAELLRGDNNDRDDDAATILDDTADPVKADADNAELEEERMVEEAASLSSSSFHDARHHEEDTEEANAAVMDDAAATGVMRSVERIRQEPITTRDDDDIAAAIVTAPKDDDEQWKEEQRSPPVIMDQRVVVVESESAAEEDKLRSTPKKENENDDDAESLASAQAKLIESLESNERHLLREISDLQGTVDRLEEDRYRVQRSLESAHADLARVLFKCTCYEQRLTSSSVNAEKKPTTHHERRSWWGGGERRTIRVGGATKVNGGEGVVASPQSTSFELNGQSLGNGAYLLAGQPHRSASENNVLWTAYRAASDDNNVGGDELLTTTGNDEALMVKVSSDREAIRREYENYQRLLGGASELTHFVKVWDMLPDAKMSDEPLSTDHQSAALVMERGMSDLTAHMAHIGRGLVGSSLQDAGRTALHCLKSLHDSDLCWTDLKSDNFVVFGDPKKGTISFKGIDLESARPVGECPIGFSPEACPPEFAAAFLSGTARDFRLEFSYDVWSFGIYMYELSTGRSFFEGKSPAEITNMLPVFDPALFEEVLVDCVPDRDLADLIARCLQFNPERRPTVDQILQDPFFRRATSTRSNRSQHAHML